MAGYETDLQYLAVKVGELKALSASVSSLATGLECGGDLGPGDIGGAANELAEQFRTGVAKMADKIDDMAGAVDGALAGYAEAERAGYEAFGSDQCPTIPAGGRP